jgi:hypothetical protein
MSTARGVVKYGLPISVEVLPNDAALLASLLLSPGRPDGLSSFAFVAPPRRSASCTIMMSERSARFLLGIADLPTHLIRMLEEWVI